MAALRGTAAVTCVPSLVEPAYLDKANGRVIAGQIVGNELAGPAAGGWLFGMAAVLPFAVNAGTLGIAVLLLLTLPAVFAPPPRPRHEPGTARPWLSSARHDLGEGLRWVWQHAAIRDVTLIAGVVSAMDAAWFAVFVLYVMKILHQQAGAYRRLQHRHPGRRSHGSDRGRRHRRYRRNPRSHADRRGTDRRRDDPAHLAAPPDPIARSIPVSQESSARPCTQRIRLAAASGWSPNSCAIRPTQPRTPSCCTVRLMAAATISALGASDGWSPEANSASHHHASFRLCRVMASCAEVDITHHPGSRLLKA